MIRKWHIVGVACMFASVASQAADWKPVGNTSDQFWFIDISSIYSVSGTKVAWLKRVDKDDGKHEANKKRYTLVKYAAHCRSQQLQLMSWASYNADGQVIYSNSKPAMPEDIFPESAGEKVVHTLCNPKSEIYKRPSVHDVYQFTDDFFGGLPE